MRVWVAVGLVVLSAGSIARAEPSPESDVRAKLIWERTPGTEGCADGAQLTRDVENRLGRRVFFEDDAVDVVLRGRSTRDAGGWGATLSTHSAKGESIGRRVLSTQAADCSSLDDALALVIALTVDVSREELELRIPEDTWAPRAPWTVEVGLGGVATLGALPSFAPGLRALVALTPPTAWRIELALSGFLPQEQSVAPGVARFSLADVALLICPLRGTAGDFRVHACAGQQLGALSAQGSGFYRDRSERRLTLDAKLRGLVRYPVAAWAFLLGGVDVDYHAIRDDFRIGRGTSSGERVFRRSIFEGRLDLGVAFRFQ